MGQHIQDFDDKYQTNDVCPKSGAWICKDHPAVVIRLAEGEVFPDCYHVRGHPTIWHYREG